MGQVVDVPIHENEYVRKGDVLFALDRRPFEAALAEAQGGLRQAEQGTRADTSEVAAVDADVARMRADLANAEQPAADGRARAPNFMSKQALDDAQARVSVARAAVDAGSARAAKARVALATMGGSVTPAVRVAQAEGDRARLDLEHAVMRATEEGWITRFDLTPGTVVTPGSPLFAIVVGHSFWVDANFKETELGGVHPGQPATIVVDMYPGHLFHGRVESLAGGTGAAFSLLPPQNANGNWVKSRSVFRCASASTIRTPHIRCAPGRSTTRNAYSVALPAAAFASSRALDESRTMLTASTGAYAPPRISVWAEWPHS
jgi:membrane fusion protein (multidrug efflux system)